jgi:hypothetical protein
VEKNWTQEKSDGRTNHRSALAKRNLIDLVGATSYDLPLHKTYPGTENRAAYRDDTESQEFNEKVFQVVHQP